MVSSGARTVERYLAVLPAQRRAALEVVRSVILENLPDGFEEGMEFGMIGYYVPLERYPDTYNGRPLCIAGLAAQKNHMAVYLMGVYGHPQMRRWFEKAVREAGKKLDMGKSCVRFRSLDDLALPVLGEAIRRVSVEAYLTHYENSRRSTRPARPRTAAKTAAARGKVRSAAAKKPPRRRAAAKRRVSNG